VLASFNRFIALPATIGAMVALCGCSSLDTSGTWFSRPADFFGSKGGYTYSDLSDNRRDRPITANDLIDGNGSCPRPVTASSVQPGAAADDTATLLGQGVAIGMSECDVVQRLGQPNNVNLGQNPNGLRGAVLTYTAGPRPGVYRFEGGKLTEMDRVEQPPMQAEQKAPPQKKVAKKKPAAPAQPAKSGSNS
jgi:hypothetical protein